MNSSCSSIYVTKTYVYIALHTANILLTTIQVISLSDIFISPLEDIYFVTELLGTDLHRLLTSRPLEKQFIQYFLYQILVS